MELAEQAATKGAGHRGSSAEAFEFVKSLAVELSSNKIELPSFPDIAVRVQRVLADDNVTPDRVVRVIGGEPALAAKLMSMANSAALNPSGRQISDLRNAVARLGFDMIRSVAITFAMSQLRKADQFKGIEKHLNLLWHRSVTVAALSFVIAKHCGKASADAAMLTGLLHNVGRLYVLTRASKFPALFGDTAAYNSIVRDWHANIAKALLENWQMADEIVEAVHGCEDPEREFRDSAYLTDILAASTLFASFKDQPDVLEANLIDCKATQRLGLDRAAFEKILLESAHEMTALREALGS
jgi:HD-like signal output (HDOD) protein